MRSLHLRIWALCLVALLAFSPVTLLAQAVSPNARTAIVNGAAQGAGWISGAGLGAPAVVNVPEVEEPEVEEPEVEEPEVEEPEVEEPEVEEPEVDEPEVDEPEVDEPEVDEPEVEETESLALGGEVASYQNAGLAIAAPVEWDVTATTMFDNLFTMEVPGSEIVGLIQGGDALDFPGVMAVIIMRVLPEFIVAQFGEGALYLGTEVLTTPQDMPVVKIEFEADLEGMPMAGAFYTLSPGASAYIMIALAPVADWPSVAAEMDAVAASIEFEPSLVTLEMAVDEPIYVVDVEETLEIVLPTGWQAAATDDPDLPILAVSPGYDYVAALTATREIDEEVVTLLDEALIDGEVNDEIVALVMDLMSDSMALDEESLALQPDMSEFFVVRDELVLRMVGSIEVDDGVSMPAGIYVGLRRDGLSALIVFGDIDMALADEETLIEILDSLLFIR